MTKWLQSGRRRDICALLYEVDQLRGQKLKTSLEAHYDTHIDSKSFYAGLRSLTERGFVETRTEGIHDAYALTEAGERALEAHYEWLSERLSQRD
ncbi:helix-turn-helix transcriptional regulator [Halorussus amylolyticus]|uniref:helix-turn-helix transcriptional regulator n=1 Tax=Halorussus amylolyticus TaxID=1126242 RepID=UPI00104444FB|nr:helix-turn-helix transcriptional regulator [Halorussus amylolyticus]